MQKHKLEYEQQQLEKEIADMQEAFDGALSLLRREKLSLETDVKAAHIKRLIYQQEMQLLKVICHALESQRVCVLVHMLCVQPFVPVPSFVCPEPSHFQAESGMDKQ